METKTCTKCGETKPIADYSRRGKAADGTQRYQYWCKACANAYRARYYDQNRESELAYQKAYREIFGDVIRKKRSGK
jgi:hypothetical protein